MNDVCSAPDSGQACWVQIPSAERYLWNGLRQMIQKPTDWHGIIRIIAVHGVVSGGLE